ncbi:MAG TPA: D-alanine--D-alanine ligase family protein [Actinomycetales bacterium]|nr:D-alanine--D-alanine ligase family protein [Actinomycetales bacterium]
MAQTDSRKKVAVLFGGSSGEHEVSCVTAGGVFAALDPERYEVYAIGITRSGRWVLSSPDAQQWQIVDGVLPHLADHGTEVLLPQRQGDRQWRLINREGQIAGLADIDVVIPLLHGPYGEDGTIQGALDLLNIPYVGSGVLASAACMDKQMMKAILTDAGLPIGKYVALMPGQWEHDEAGCRQRIAELGLPVFVKPARAGSSLGISRVDNLDDLQVAISEAQKFDPKLVVEAAITGREIECAVLDVIDNGKPRISLPGEIVVREGAFYDYESKYVNTSGIELRAPADLPPSIIKEIQHLADRAFRAVDAEGLARVDFFVTESEEILVNELNTMPGFTPYSMYPKLWEVSGLSYGELIDELISLALARPVGLR